VALKTPDQKLVRIGVIAVAVLIVLLLAGTANLAVSYLRAEAWVSHTTDVISAIRDTRALLPGTQVLSEAALRAKAADIQRQFELVNGLISDNPRQVQNASDFRGIFYSSGAENSKWKTEIDAQDIAAAGAILDEMQREEERLLIQRIEVQSTATREGAILGFALCVALLVLGLVTGLALRRELRMRTLAEQALTREKDDLTAQTQQLAMVSAGSRMMQAARDEDQVNAAVGQVLRELAPQSRGYFAAVSPSNDMVEISVSWGCDKPPETFLPSDCLALQIGRTVHRSTSLVHVDCRHAVPASGDYVCIPVQSANGAIGVLHVATQQLIDKKLSDVIEVFAAHAGLELANLRMREALRSQTVRDQLTGLFNRRYFDETLSRELAVAARRGSTLAVLMIDVDHFKQLNDSQGHSAGDDALRGFARALRPIFRESDVLCRYGGEEFAVILPEVDLNRAFERAEQLRRVVTETELHSGDTALGNLTISIGIASSAEFVDPAAIVGAADAALYEAKRTGRNRTCVCSLEETKLPSIRKGTVAAG
jgi:diguanylate cyclase (GGDEF)-like protein